MFRRYLGASLALALLLSVAPAARADSTPQTESEA